MHSPSDQFWCEEGGVDVVLGLESSGIFVAVRATVNGETRLLGGTVAWFRAGRLRDRLTELIESRGAANANGEVGE